MSCKRSQSWVWQSEKQHLLLQLLQCVVVEAHVPPPPVLILSSVSSVLWHVGAPVRAQVEAAGRAGDHQVPVYPGPGVSEPCSRLRGITAAGHGLGQHRHGGQAGWGGREGWQDKRGLPHLLHARTVSVGGVGGESREECGEGMNRSNASIIFSFLIYVFLSFFCIFPDWTNVWTSSSKQIDCQKLHSWQEHTFPAMCQGNIISIECSAYAHKLLYILFSRTLPTHCKKVVTRSKSVEDFF